MEAGPKKRGRPATGRGPMLSFRGPNNGYWIDRIDKFAERYPGMSRSDAIRCLIDLGLTVPKDRRQTLFDPLSMDSKAWETFKYQPTTEEQEKILVRGKREGERSRAGSLVRVGFTEEEVQHVIEARRSIFAEQAASKPSAEVTPGPRPVRKGRGLTPEQVREMADRAERHK
jgi:hypothetical protein